MRAPIERSGATPKEYSELKDFYESRIWKTHKIGNLYELIRFQYIHEFLVNRLAGPVLDAGCGGGTYTQIMANVSSVIAVDISVNAIRNAKENLARSKDVSFIVGDLGHLPLRGGIVSKVASIDVLEHIKKPEQAVGEVCRILQPYGSVLLFTACGENKLTMEYMLKPLFGKLILSIRSRLGHVSIFTNQSIHTLLCRDFTIVRIRYMHHWLGWLIKFLWDMAHMNSLESHQSQCESKVSGSSLSRMLWVMLEAEYKLLRKRDLGTEIIINATKKSF